MLGLAFSLADARKVSAFSLADVTSLIQFVYSPRIVLATTCSNGVGRLNIHVITEGQFMNSPIILILESLRRISHSILEYKDCRCSKHGLVDLIRHSACLNLLLLPGGDAHRAPHTVPGYATVE